MEKVCARYVRSNMAVLMDWAVGFIPLPSCWELDQAYGLICLEGKLGFLVSKQQVQGKMGEFSDTPSFLSSCFSTASSCYLPGLGQAILILGRKEKDPHL